MNRTVAVVGPTAVGKSAVAIEFAAAVGGEIVNADSMQLYRGMDIGTAKVPVAQRGGIPHHMLDVLDVTQTASAAAFQARARAIVAEIHGRGRVAVVVGGSGLFVDALLDDMQFPGSDPELRAQLEGELANVGSVAMHARLAQVAPQAARDILATNGRRIVRALEVIELTGKPPVTQLARLKPFIPTVRLGLTRSREELDLRIAQRVEDMWRQGLVSEVAGLVRKGLRDGRTASKALGYQQVLAAIDGHCSEDEARENTVVGTRRYVRRQESWFRRDARICWFPAGRTPVSALVDHCDLDWNHT